MLKFNIGLFEIFSSFPAASFSLSLNTEYCSFSVSTKTFFNLSYPMAFLGLLLSLVMESHFYMNLVTQLLNYCNNFTILAPPTFLIDAPKKLYCDYCRIAYNY